jgi:hypothetical protein
MTKAFSNTPTLGHNGFWTPDEPFPERVKYIINMTRHEYKVFESMPNCIVIHCPILLNRETKKPSIIIAQHLSKILTENGVDFGEKPFVILPQHSHLHSPLRDIVCFLFGTYFLGEVSISRHKKTDQFTDVQWYVPQRSKANSKGAREQGGRTVAENTIFC